MAQARKVDEGLESKVRKTDESDKPEDPGRRKFLKMLGLGAAVAAGAGLATTLLSEPLGVRYWTVKEIEDNLVGDGKGCFIFKGGKVGDTVHIKDKIYQIKTEYKSKYTNCGCPDGTYTAIGAESAVYWRGEPYHEVHSVSVHGDHTAKLKVGDTFVLTSPIVTSHDDEKNCDYIRPDLSDRANKNTVKKA